MAKVNAHCGEGFSAFLDDEQQLWMVGVNNCGECGRPEREYSRLVKLPVVVIRNIANVAVGRTFTICCDTNGALYGFGRNENLELCQGDTSSRHRPVRIAESLPDLCIASIYCGTQFTFCVDTVGDLWVFGDNYYHQQGKQNPTSYLPMKIPEVSHITQVSCGHHHAICKDEFTNFYVFGRSAFQGAFITPSAIKTNTLDDFKDDIVSFSCGMYHSVFLLGNGAVYSYTDLTAWKNWNKFAEQEIHINELPPIRSVACSKYKTFCIDTEGNVWVVTEPVLCSDEKRITTQLEVSNIRDMAAPNDHTFFRDYEGRVFFYGNSRYIVPEISSKKVEIPVDVTSTFGDIMGNKNFRAKSARK